jgi:hypothetical protein
MRRWGEGKKERITNNHCVCFHARYRLDPVRASGVLLQSMTLRGWSMFLLCLLLVPTRRGPTFDSPQGAAWPLWSGNVHVWGSNSGMQVSFGHCGSSSRGWR